MNGNKEITKRDHSKIPVSKRINRNQGASKMLKLQTVKSFLPFHCPCSQSEQLFVHLSKKNYKVCAALPFIYLFFYELKSVMVMFTAVLVCQMTLHFVAFS